MLVSPSPLANHLCPLALFLVLTSSNVLFHIIQMGEIVTFLLTTVYAQSALLRIREYYLNKGKPLLIKVY